MQHSKKTRKASTTVSKTPSRAALACGLSVLASAAMWPGQTAQAQVVAPSSPAAVASPAVQRPTMAVVAMTPDGPIAQAAKRRGDGASLARFVSQLDAALVTQVLGQRRLQVVARHELQALLEDNDLEAALAADPVAVFGMAHCEYGLVVRVTDFVDDELTAKSDSGGVLSRVRRGRVACQATLYDTKTKVALAAFDVQLEDTASRLGMAGERANAQGNDSLASHDEGGTLWTQLAQQTARQLAQEITGQLYPPRVLMVVGNRAVINRGERAGVQIGQRWTVSALHEVEDPDFPGQSVRVEMPMGEMVVEQVGPDQSQGRLVEDFGVDNGMVLRLKAQAVAPAGAASANGAVPF